MTATIQPGEGDIRMDCADNLRFLRDVADASLRLVVTSPPYNIGKRHESAAPLDEYVQAQAEVISECVRALSESGSKYLIIR
jgi:adenine-specific DNA-methyltransferase